MKNPKSYKSYKSMILAILTLLSFTCFATSYETNNSDCPTINLDMHGNYEVAKKVTKKTGVLVVRYQERADLYVEKVARESSLSPNIHAYDLILKDDSGKILSRVGYTSCYASPKYMCQEIFDPMARNPRKIVSLIKKAGLTCK